MWYTLPDSSKHYPLTIQRVKEIQRINARGEKVDELQPVDLSAGKNAEAEHGFVELVGQVSLRSLEKTSRRVREKENRPPDRRNNDNQPERRSNERPQDRRPNERPPDRRSNEQQPDRRNNDRQPDRKNINRPPGKPQFQPRKPQGPPPPAENK